MTVPPAPSDPHRHDARRPDGSPAWYADAASHGVPADGAATPGAPTNGSSAAGWPDAPAPGAPYGRQQAHGGPAYAPAPAYTGAPLGPGQESSTGLAVASLILGVFSLVGGAAFLVPPIVGVVLGHMSRRREPNGRGMALAGLITNYIALGLMALGLALLVILVAIGIAADPGTMSGGISGGLNA